MQKSILGRTLVSAGWVLLILVVFVIFILVLPILFLVGLYLLIAEATFQGWLWCCGRTIAWVKAREQIREHGATLILEAFPNGGGIERAWLLHERLAKLDPGAPWPVFRDLQQRLRYDNQTLTVPEEFSTWCRDRLPKLAPSVRLIRGLPSVATLVSLHATTMPENSIIVVPMQQMTSSVRGSFWFRPIRL